MRIIKKLLYIVNAQVRKTHWFRKICFPECDKFRTYNRFKTIIVNLGSTSSLHAFNYEGITVPSANWAIERNPIVGDMAILKNYHSFLEPGKSTVLLPLCPFSSLSGRYDYLDDRYYTFLYPTSIPDFSIQRLNQVMERYNNPMRYYPAVEMFAWVGRLLKKNRDTLSEEEMQKDAEKWYDGWLKEFSLNDLQGPLSLLNKDSISEYCDHLKEMIRFCEERELNFYIVIPPVYKTLRIKFSQQAYNTLFSSILNVASQGNVKVLDYFLESDFTNRKDLFLNSFFLNKKGAQLFTKRVLSDLSLI